jgi:O-antigen ligase
LRRLALVGAVLIVGAGIATFKDLPGIDRLSGRGAAAQSDVAREAIYGHVIHEVEQRPIVGHGFEYLKGSHNIYLQVLHSGGVIALLGLITLVVGVIATGLRVSSRSQQPIVRALLASSLVWLAVDGLFEPAIFDRYLYVPIGLLLACWSVNRRSDERQPTPDKSHLPDVAPDIEVASRVPR